MKEIVSGDFRKAFYMKMKVLYNVIILSLILTIGIALISCGRNVLSGKEYLEARGMSAIDIIGEAKYVYDMTYYTGDKVDVNDTLQGEDGKTYYRILEGELSTFKYDDLKVHLSAYFNEKFIDFLLEGRIIADKENNIYTIGYYEPPQISYIDYKIKQYDKTEIVYEVTVFYDEKVTARRPATYSIEQECIDGNWLFVNHLDFNWGVSPL